MSQAAGEKLDVMNADAGQPDATRQDMAAGLCEVAQHFAHRGWALGGGGHFSVALRRDPVRLLITPDGIDKATVTAGDCRVLEHDRIEDSWPEARMHALLVRHAQAGAVIHTQSPAALALSEGCAAQGGLMLEGYDLLRQFTGARFADQQWVPIIDHAPQSAAPGRQLIAQLTDPRRPAKFGALVRRCGLLAWGDDLEQARRHAEIFETLFATIVSRLALGHTRH